MKQPKLKKILIPLSAIIIFLIAIYIYGYRSATRLPDNRPEVFLESGPADGKKTIVCIGNSITHGRVSHNYVDELAKRLEPDSVSLVNAGINGELAYNVLQRIDEIIRCRPDVITVLVGTNDALASLNSKNAERYIREMKLPQKPNIVWYETNLAAIVDRLQAETDAAIAILSLPPITEDRTHTAYQRAIEYSEVAQRIAREKNLAYLPLNETMTRRIEQSPSDHQSNYQGGDQLGLYTAILSYYLLGRSWNDIADARGFVYLTDSIHLNGRGAGLVADLVEGFFQSRFNGG